MRVSSGKAISADQSAEDVRRQVGLRSRYPMLRFTDITDHEQAMRMVRLAGEVVSGRMPVWLELDLGLPDVWKVVDSLADHFDARRFTPHTVLQPMSGDRAGLSELQAHADSRIPPRKASPGIVIATDDVWSARDALNAAEAGIRGIVVNPHRLGGLLPSVEAVHQVQGHHRHARPGVSVFSQVSAITARAVADAAMVAPGVEYLTVDPDELTDLVEAKPPLHLDKKHRIVPGVGAGIGAQVNLAPAVHRLSRATEAPASQKPALTHGPHAANTFTDRHSGISHIVSHLLERAALARGLDTVRLSPKVFTAYHAQLREPLGFSQYKANWTSAASHAATFDKDLTRKALLDAGVPVPQGKTFGRGRVRQAVKFAASLGQPVVVKPRSGGKGVGVSTDLRTEADVRRAIGALDETKYAGQDFIVERYITGADYRFLVVGDRVVSVVMRTPASVVGDGRSSIVDLVVEKNQTRLRNPHMRTRLIPLGHEAHYWLDRQGLTLDSVPDDGQQVRLSSAANGSLGADTFEVLDETNPSLLELAVRATRAVPGIDHAGIDIIGDHRRGADDASIAILEVNGSPGTLLHHFPLFGPPQDVSDDLVMRSCDLAGFQPGEPCEKVTVRIQVHGGVQRVGYRAWFARRANHDGLTGHISNPPTGGVEAYVSGPLVGVSQLATAAMTGPPRARVDHVVTTHVPMAETTDRFEVR